MREELFIPSTTCASTPNERWSLEPAKHSPPGRGVYDVFAEHAKLVLGIGNLRSCLVIGSAIFEAVDLIKQGWDVTYMDVRTPPLRNILHFIQCDATKMTVEDQSFDAVSSSCVLCHAGLGRYGDKIVENGDELMLKEIYRVMKPGALAAITFGPVASMSKMVRMGTCHRVYNPPEVRRMVKAVGFTLETTTAWSSNRKMIDSDKVKMSVDPYKPDYIGVAVRRG